MHGTYFSAMFTKSNINNSETGDININIKHKENN